MLNRKHALSTAIWPALSILAAFGCDGGGRPVVGRVAPEIEGEDLHGEGFKLSDYRGKVVVLDFWGHW